MDDGEAEKEVDRERGGVGGQRTAKAVRADGGARERPLAEVGVEGASELRAVGVGDGGAPVGVGVEEEGGGGVCVDPAGCGQTAASVEGGEVAVRMCVGECFGETGGAGGEQGGARGGEDAV